MLKRIKNVDLFTKNILIVFLGSSLLNFINLVYQLLIAHKLSPVDFAAFNSMLAIYMLISSPLGTIQTAVAKYTAEFNGSGQFSQTQALLSGFFRKTLIMAIVTFFIFLAASFLIIARLKINCNSCGYILAILLALAWINPVIFGGVQGLELFKWSSASSVISGILKLGLAFIFIALGWGISGALGALVISTLAGIFVLYLPIKKNISAKARQHNIDYREIYLYLLPVAISTFCFINLVSFDMVLVKYYFSPEESGVYSLAQMVGKIFLFLPGAISVVMFPRVSGLNARNLSTFATLRRSLFYTCVLVVAAGLVYNFFPYLVLKVLTGKAYLESVVLGRLFSVSMSFFTLLFILITYFLSIKDLRFIKYLVLFTALQFWSITLFHKSLVSVQLILCINAILLFFIHLTLVYKKQRQHSFQVAR
ncbi:MAG: oligosaccharide flippase family protein [Candidatus Omnitrophica bacterium]|nr:oligosaccharide flippase family protein [Candidatus Omnitrophota bacterium]